MPLIVRILLCAVAVVMLALAAFFYEDEQKQLQSWLVDWWVRLDDRRVKTEATEQAVIARFCSFTARLLDDLFGQKLLSIQAVAVSLIASMFGSLIFGICLNFIAFPGLGLYEHLAALSGFALLIAAWALLIARRKVKPVSINWLMVIVACSTVPYLGCGLQQMGTGSSLILYLGAILLAVASDFLVITLLRIALRRFSGGAISAWKALLMVGSALVLMILLVYLPFSAAFPDDKRHSVVLEGLYGALGLTFLLNISDAVALFAILVLVATLFMSHAFWIAILRPLYTLQRIDLFDHKKELCGVAIALLGIALVPAKEGWAKAILEVVRRLFGGDSASS